jgi:chaperonin GroEL
MKIPKELLFAPELGEKIRSGSKALRRVVAANFGPDGRNTIREQTYDLPLVANTGRRVLQEFSLADNSENVGALLVRDAALKLADECGDGSIATAILTDALISEGLKLIAAGYNPVELRNGAQKALHIANESLNKITTPFEEIDAERFAISSAKNGEVARNVLEAFNLVGADGVITVQDTQTSETVLNFWDGVRYEYGLFSTAFMNNPDKRKAVLTEPYVLLSNIKINSFKDIQKVLEDVVRSGSSLLIITNDMTDDVQRALLSNIAHGLKVVVTKAPGFGDTRRRNMLALAAKTGSLIFDDNTGREMKDCGLEVCSQIGSMEADKDSTVLIGFRDTSQEMVDILTRHTLSAMDETTDADERDKLMTTLSILNGKTAEILVGAPIEYEMFEKKYLYENAVRVMQNAAESGLVPGAGNAYVYAAEKLEDFTKGWPEGERLGALSLCNAMRNMLKVLVDNAGEDGAFVLSKLNVKEDPYLGYDVLSRKIVDLKETGILTPCSTLKATINVAVSTASSLWTVGAAVIDGK